jgi:hypothetical protein
MSGNTCEGGGREAGFPYSSADQTSYIHFPEMIKQAELVELAELTKLTELTEVNDFSELKGTVSRVLEIF